MCSSDLEQIGTDDIGPIIVLLPAGVADGRWNVYLLMATAAMLLLAVLFWPIKAILRWRYDRPFALAGRAAALYRWTRVVALIDLVFLAGFPLGIQVAVSGIATWGPSIDLLWRGLQILGVIGVIGTIVPLWNFAVALRDPARPWWTKATDEIGRAHV